MTNFTESIIEQAAIDWLKELGYDYAFGPEIAFDSESTEHRDYKEPFLPKLMKGEVWIFCSKAIKNY